MALETAVAAARRWRRSAVWRQLRAQLGGGGVAVM